MSEFASERATGRRRSRDAYLFWLFFTELALLSMVFGMLLAAFADADGVRAFGDSGQILAQPMSDGSIDRQGLAAPAETAVILWDEAGRDRALAAGRRR